MELPTAGDAPKEVKLAQQQIEHFYKESGAQRQAQDFLTLCPEDVENGSIDLVVDVGGGIGAFATQLNALTALPVVVLDSDPVSIRKCNEKHLENVRAVLGDALDPPAFEGRKCVTFNLILHHLIGRSERETRHLQTKALQAWKGKAHRLFVNEYIYNSYIGHASGRLIFEITSSRLLSRVGSVVAKFVPSLKANTFGVGVRFRATEEWKRLFEEAGFIVLDTIPGAEEPVSLPRRILLIRQKRKVSFLLQERTPNQATFSV
jgi:hypothetical protein